MKKYIILLVILVIGITAGNRIFNHVEAWGGMIIILSSVSYVIYKLIKYNKNEKD